MCLLLPVKNMNVLINPKTFNLSELALQYFLHPEDGSIKHQLPFKPKQEKKTEMLQTAHAFSFEFLTGPDRTTPDPPSVNFGNSVGKKVAVGVWYLIWKR